jgi:RNA polymerase sigma-70 factor (ECF subfamily)
VDWSEASRRLSSIETLWSLVRRAHDEPGERARAAQGELIARYGGAIRRYLIGALRDEEAAEELFQEFAYRFVHGDLRGADPERGRFRDFVKGVLYHLIADHHKRRQRQPRALASGYAEPAVNPPTLADLDRDLRTNWRDDLLARTWAALGDVEREKGQPFHTVLRFRAEHPDMPSPEMANRLSVTLGKPINAAAVRQMLHRAREKFADLLLEQVAHSLDDPNPEQLGQELEDLGLIDHVRPALERRGAGA